MSRWIANAMVCLGICVAVVIGARVASWDADAPAMAASAGDDDAEGRCARCGDGVCAPSCETAASCPRDCGTETLDDAEGRCARCGDGVCARSCETAASCPRDCGTPSVAELAPSGACGKCGDNYCNPRCGETSTSCPRDCGIGAESATAL